MHVDELLALDRGHVWHPYGADARPRRRRSSVESARGACGWPSPSTGRELVDGMSSWWSAIHGYRHPVLDAAVADQLGRMSHVMFGGLTHEPAVAPGARGWWSSPRSRCEHVFLADSGSVSVEVAVKMCLQYQRSRGPPGEAAAADLAGRLLRRHLQPDVASATPRAACTACGAACCRAQVFADAPPDGFDAPADAATAAHLATWSREHADELAAIIVEPVVQGAGGMRFHTPGLPAGAARASPTRHDVLLVFDEIATGLRAHRARCSPPSTPA